MPCLARARLHLSPSRACDLPSPFWRVCVVLSSRVTLSAPSSPIRTRKGWKGRNRPWSKGDPSMSRRKERRLVDRMDEARIRDAWTIHSCETGRGRRANSEPTHA
eukprot:scaffold285_cov330-Pavlova_lutheri.AAC.5